MHSRLSQNTLTLMTSSAGGALLSFVLSVLIGRVLGEDGLGIYTTALAWVFPLALAADAGLGTLITRDIAQNPSAERGYLHTTVTARLIIGGGLTTLLFVTAPVLSHDSAVVRGIQLAAPLVLIQPFYGAFTAVFRARRVMWPVALLNLGMLISQVVLTAAVFLSGWGIFAALATNTFTSAGQLACAGVIYRWRFHHTETPIKPPNLNNLLRQAYPFAIAAILAALHNRISVILLEQFTNTSEVGYYAAAARFVEAGRLIPHAFFDALFPLLAALVIRPEAFKQMFQRVTLGLVLFGMLAAVGGWFLAETAIALTYGEAFKPAILIFQIGVLTLLPMLLKGGRTLYWYAQGKEQFVNRITGLALLLRIGLSIWWLPYLGALGVMLVNLVVEIVSALLLWRRQLS